MFDEQQKIAINLLKINHMSKQEFLLSCTHFDPKENLNYHLPTPTEVYETFSSYKLKVLPSDEKLVAPHQSIENVQSETQSEEFESKEQEPFEI